MAMIVAIIIIIGLAFPQLGLYFAFYPSLIDFGKKYFATHPKQRNTQPKIK